MLLSSHILVVPALNGTLVSKLQITQNKFIHFCFKSDKRYHISIKELRSIYWLSVYESSDQCINAITFKVFDNAGLYYLNEVYEYATPCRIESRSNLSSLIFFFGKLTLGWTACQTLISLYGTIYPDQWKKTTCLNTFKHNLKKQDLSNLGEARIVSIIIGFHLHCVPILLLYLYIYSFICFSFSFIWPLF